MCAHVPGGLGTTENRSFSPVYYESDACSGPQSMPSEITNLTPSPHGLLWTQPSFASVPMGTGSSWLRYGYDSAGGFSVSFD